MEKKISYFSLPFHHLDMAHFFSVLSIDFSLEISGEWANDMEQRGPNLMVLSYQLINLSSLSKNLILPSLSPVTTILK